MSKKAIITVCALLPVEVAGSTKFLWACQRCAPPWIIWHQHQPGHIYSVLSIFSSSVLMPVLAWALERQKLWSVGHIFSLIFCLRHRIIRSRLVWGEKAPEWSLERVFALCNIGSDPHTRGASISTSRFTSKWPGQAPVVSLLCRFPQGGSMSTSMCTNR